MTITKGAMLDYHTCPDMPTPALLNIGLRIRIFGTKMLKDYVTHMVARWEEDMKWEVYAEDADTYAAILGIRYCPWCGEKLP